MTDTLRQAITGDVVTMTPLDLNLADLVAAIAIRKFAAYLRSEAADLRRQADTTVFGWRAGPAALESCADKITNNT